MKETIKDKILAAIKASDKKSFSMEELAELLNFAKGEDFKVLVQTIATM